MRERLVGAVPLFAAVLSCASPALAQSQKIRVQAWDFSVSTTVPIASADSVAGAGAASIFNPFPVTGGGTAGGVPAGTDRINIFSVNADSNDSLPRVSWWPSHR